MWNINKKKNVIVKNKNVDIKFSAYDWFLEQPSSGTLKIRVITKLPNFEQSNKGKVKTHKYINRQNQSTTGKLWKSKDNVEYIYMHCIFKHVICIYTGAVVAVIVWQLDLQLPMESVPITTNVVTSNLGLGEVHNIMW